MTLPTILITGGARRIGHHIAVTLHNAGYNIMVHYRSSSNSAHALVTQLNDARANSAASVQCDLLDLKCLPNVIDATIDTFGRLDGLINNASTFYPTPIELLEDEFWNDLMGSNLKAPAFLAKYAAPHLKKQNGCIINIIDIYARSPLANHPIYCSAKAGLEMLTKSLAYDLAPNVRVNGIAPGAILWPESDSHSLNQADLLKKIPLQRMGDPSDIANTALFFIQQVPYITGQILAVDGGRSISI